MPAPGAGATLAVAYALAWSVASTLIILLNKRVMAPPSAGGLGFAFPMTLTFLGAAFSSAAAAAALAASAVARPAGARRGIGWAAYVRGVVPCSCCAAVTLVSGNAAYATLSVSFIQMLKAATPLFTLAVSFLLLGSDPAPVVGPTSLIAVGTAISSYAEVNAHPAGLAHFFLSAAAEAFRIVMMQLLLRDSAMGALEATYYFSPACALALLACLLVFELPGLRSHGLGVIAANPGTFALASTLGFGVNVTTLLFIGVAGSLTFKVVGNAKNIVVILLGVLLFGDPVTPLQCAGYAISMVGFTLYQRAQARGAPARGASAPARGVPAQARAVQAPAAPPAAPAAGQVRRTGRRRS